jgi:YbgC/YbaW family acyl-CoA thioester hydrolase
MARQSCSKSCGAARASWQLAVTEDGAREIAKRSRGTPRIAGRLLRRVRDFAVGRCGQAVLMRRRRTRRLRALDVDHAGLDALDHRYLNCIALNFGGGPVGIDTIAASLSEGRDALEDVVEPYLLQLGFLNRTPRGRLLTHHAFRHLGLPCRTGRRSRKGCCRWGRTVSGRPLQERRSLSGGPRLLRGHGFFRQCLSRQLSEVLSSGRARISCGWLGIDQNAMFASGEPIMFVVRRMACDFLRPARFDDLLTVETRGGEMAGARFELAQRVLRGEEVLFTAEVTVALIDGRGRPKRVPPEMAQRLPRAIS